jgi:hypothetical protein
MSYSCYDDYYEQACEYVVPIKLVVPVFIEPKVFTQSVCTREKIQVTLEPEIYLEPEVRAKQLTCIPQNGYHQTALAAETIG